MNILKYILLAFFTLLFINSTLNAQIFFESTIKPTSTNDAYGLFINDLSIAQGQECFIGYEFHNDHEGSENNHYRIALRPSDAPGAKGAFIAQTGQFAVGSNDPCARIFDENSNVMLSVEGEAAKTGDASWYGESDRRLKKNIARLEKSRDKFMSIKIYSYKYKQSEKVRYGIMAQEVKKDFPHSIGTVKKHDEEFLTFNPNNLFFTGMKVIQENSKEIIAQEEQIRSLEAEIQSLSVDLRAERNRNNRQQTRLDAIEAALASQGIDLSNLNSTETLPKPTENNPRLEQNIPNPFSQFTSIPYYLPEETQSAKLIIYDIAGKAVSTHILSTQNGEGKIEIDLKDTQPNRHAFTYSLYVNEHLIDTKKMVLSSK